MMQLFLGLVVVVALLVCLFAALWRSIKRAERPVPPEDAELVRRIVARAYGRHEVAP